MRLRLACVAVCLLALVPEARAGGGGTSSGTDTGTTGTDTGNTESGSESGSSESGTTSGSGTTGSTGTDSGTGSTSTTGETTGTGSDTSTGGADDTTTEPDPDTGTCGACPTGDESIAFDEPADGADVDAPFAVVVDAVPRCPCFDCDCPAEDFEYVQLFLDSAAWGGPCYASPCTWEVTATLGGHTLDAVATYPGGQASTRLEVTVVGIDPGTTGDPDSGPPEPTSSPTEPTESGAGIGEDPPPRCGCGAPTAPDPTTLALALGLLRLVKRRRRAR